MTDDRAKRNTPREEAGADADADAVSDSLSEAGEDADARQDDAVQGDTLDHANGLDQTLAKPPAAANAIPPPQDSDSPSAPSDKTVRKPTDEATRQLPSAPSDKTVRKPTDEATRQLPSAPSDKTVRKPTDEATLQRPIAPSDKTVRKPTDEATLQVPQTRRHGASGQAPSGQKTVRRPGADSTADSESSQALKTFGEYDLLSVIAKGGMGVVYKARQRRLNRIVAIKMILAGQLADEADVERFYIEAEAAANLKHPNIVGIYEIGDVDGQLFYSMEYIEGQSLAQLITGAPIAPRKAAGYVKTIAEAMEYAHQQGILHRDLKPSNVLIDQDGRLHVTDFGLAKRVESQSQLTLTGTIVGTPSYMPPEQARGEIESVGVTSDVYSTGAILYELLTRVPPFHAANPFETIRQVLSAEPAAPRLINQSIPQDVETICLKALQKERPKRYQTEGELAAELGRFISDQPILARPIGRLARTWRWCRRNKTVASLLGLAAFCLVVAIVSLAVGYVRAKHARELAEQSDRESRATVDEMFIRVSEDDLLNQPGMQTLRHDLLRKALVHYEKFVRRRGDDPTIRNELAQTLFRVGYITGEIESPAAAVPWYEKALAIQLAANSQGDAELLANLGDTLNGLGVARQKTGDPGAAAKAYQEAIEVRREVLRLDSKSVAAPRKLANTMMNLGLLQQSKGDIPGARATMADAQELRAAALKHFESDKLGRDLARGFYNLGMLEQDAGNLPRAGEYFTAAEQQFAKLLEDAPHDLGNQWRLAISLRSHADVEAAQLNPTNTDSYDRALTKYSQANRYLERLATRNPDVKEYQATWVGVLRKQGQLQLRCQQYEAARASFASASTTLEQILDQSPEDSLDRYRLAESLAMQSVLAALHGEAELAAEFWQEALLQLDMIPDASSYRGNLGEVFTNLASHLLHAQQNAAAAEALAATTKIYRVVLQREPQDVQARRSLAAALCEQSSLMGQAGETSEARKLWGESKRLIDQLPDEPAHKSVRDRIEQIGSWLEGL